MIELDAAAKVAYKRYEECSDEYVEKVWSWETLDHDDPCNQYGLCARCIFEATIIEFTETARKTIEAALADMVLYEEMSLSDMKTLVDEHGWDIPDSAMPKNRLLLHSGRWMVRMWPEVVT